MWYLTGALFLGFNLGRNNLSNAFGTAIAARMFSKRFAALIGTGCLALGVILNSTATTGTVASLGDIESSYEAFMICVAAALTMMGLTYYGIPVSLSQLTIGGFSGLLFFYGRTIKEDILIEILKGWLISPLIALGISLLVSFLIRKSFKFFKVHLLYRDVIARWGLMCVGGVSCYALGSNNVASILGLYANVMPVFSPLILGMVIVVMSLGFFSCSMKVIKTVGRRLFPLTPMEALIVVMASSLTLLLFSSQWLTWGGESLLPAVPLPTAMVVIGSVLGVSFMNKGCGIRYSVLGRILFSFVAGPILSGMLCCILLTGLQG